MSAAVTPPRGTDPAPTDATPQPPSAAATPDQGSAQKASALANRRRSLRTPKSPLGSPAGPTAPAADADADNAKQRGPRLEAASPESTDDCVIVDTREASSSGPSGGSTAAQRGTSPNVDADAMPPPAAAVATVNSPTAVTAAPSSSSSSLAPPATFAAAKPAAKLTQPTLHFGVSKEGQLRHEVQDLRAKTEELGAQNLALQAEVERLRQSTGEDHRSVGESRERVERYQRTMARIMSEQAITQRREARRAQHQKHFEIGQPHMVPTPDNRTREVWVDGDRARGLNLRLEEVLARTKEVENLRKANQRTTKRSSSGVNGAASAAMVGPGALPDDEASQGLLPASDAAALDAEETNELYKMELQALRQVEASVRRDMELLAAERMSFSKEIRRIQDEDASQFAGRPVLAPTDVDPDVPGQPRREYVLLFLLGKGGFSEVWKAFDLQEGRYVACKIHRIQREWAQSTREHYARHMHRELQIQRQLDHPRLTALYDAFSYDTSTFVSVMEYSEGEDLDTRLKRCGTLKEQDAKAIFMQIIAALRYLADLPTPIIHYDLKPANIIFHSSLSSCLDVKITDFGLSKIVAETEARENGGNIDLTSHGTGTYWYLPPECFESRGGQINNKVDIWAAGAIFFQMLYGKKPFGDGLAQREIWHKQVIPKSAGKGVVFPSEPKVSEEARTLIRSCLQFRPEDRPEITVLSTDPYFRSNRKRTRPAAAAAATTSMPPPTGVPR